MALDAVDLFCQFGQQSGHVAGAGSDFENAMVRLNVQMLEHHPDNERLRNSLSLVNRNGVIGVGLAVVLGGNELMPGNASHGCEYARILNTARLQLSFHHALTLERKSLGSGLKAAKHAGNSFDADQAQMSSYFRLCRRRISKLTTPF